MVLSFVNSAAQLCEFWVSFSAILLILISWSQNGCHSSRHYVLTPLNPNRKESASFTPFFFFFFNYGEQSFWEFPRKFSSGPFDQKSVLGPLAQQSLVKQMRWALLTRLIMFNLLGLGWGPNFLQHIASSNLNKISVIHKDKKEMAFGEGSNIVWCTYFLSFL